MSTATRIRIGGPRSAWKTCRPDPDVNHQNIHVGVQRAEQSQFAGPRAIASKAFVAASRYRCGA